MRHHCSHCETDFEGALGIRRCPSCLRTSGVTLSSSSSSKSPLRGLLFIALPLLLGGTLILIAWWSTRPPEGASANDARLTSSSRRTPKEPTLSAEEAALQEESQKDSSKEQLQGQARVTVYGASWCGPCKDAQKYLKSEHIPFEYKDVDDPKVAAELSIRLGREEWGVPIIFVNNEVMEGFDKARLKLLLKKGSDLSQSL